MMKTLLKSFFYLFILITLAGFVSVKAQTDSTVISTMMGEETDVPTTTETADMTTSLRTSQAVTDSGETTKTTEAEAEGTEKTMNTEIVTDLLTTQQMPTKAETTDRSTPKQCYQCVSESEDDECVAKQMDSSDTIGCDGNCWITAFYEGSDKFVNLTRSCEDKECTDTNQDDFECKDDDTKKMCTYCCSTDRCNGMSDASYLRYNSVILMVAIIANGIFYCKVL